MWLSGKFIGLLALDGFLILIAATLSLRNHWQVAVMVITALFVANAFLLPITVRPKKFQKSSPAKRWLMPFILGCALLASALYHLMIMAAGKFTLPGVIGSVSALIVGALFIFVVIKGKRVFK